MMETSAPGIDPFPEPQHRRPGGSIRWAAGTLDGPRSQSWSLFGSTTDDDVYLGPRPQTGAIKLSLHRSGRWRMAWTEKFAKSRGWSDDVDRVLTRWEPPDEVRPGWRHAVTMLVTPESVAYPPPRDSGLGKVAFFPPPNPDDALWFRILIGQGSTELAVSGAVEVGTLCLPSNGMVGVIVRPGPLEPATVAKVAEIRAQMLAAVTAAGARRNTAFAWGRMADDAVLLIDPGPGRAGGRAAGGQYRFAGQADLRPAGRPSVLRGMATGPDAARPRASLQRCPARARCRDRGGGGARRRGGRSRV